MRLVKINDIILNMDRIVAIKGSTSSGGVIVYAYINSSNYVELGRCETKEDYEKFMSALYMQLQLSFTDKVVPIKEEEIEKELWV